MGLNEKERDQHRHKMGYEYAQSEHKRGKSLETLTSEYETGLAFDGKDDHFDYGMRQYVREQQNDIR